MWSFLVRSKPSVFLAMPLPARLSMVTPLIVVCLDVTMLNVRNGMFLMVKPDTVEPMTFCSLKKSGRVIDWPCFQYQDPWPSRMPEPLTVRSEPLTRTSGPSHFCGPKVVVPTNSMVAPVLARLRSSVTPAGTVSESTTMELHLEMSVPFL
ncbi:hypothetical protein PF008_g31354 [Phytophthora fragariae]|uniref:Uncharacterized protein n=1 Tax=Phytophthora fragariae TaxID=53985 RepID=A0A6G0Q3E5_9STRA|nr:hypothetical protein PF008_g31354 [Phytophthora fragariae]